MTEEDIIVLKLKGDRVTYSTNTEFTADVPMLSDLNIVDVLGISATFEDDDVVEWAIGVNYHIAIAFTTIADAFVPMYRYDVGTIVYVCEPLKGPISVHVQRQNIMNLQDT